MGITVRLVLLILVIAGVPELGAHPGSGIAVDGQGQVYFVDTGQGVWKIDTGGRLTLIHSVAYHWLALDSKGVFANPHALGNFDRGSFELATPPNSVPAIIISSDYPVAAGSDGGLYYVPYDRGGKRQLIRRTPDGQRSVFALLPASSGPEPMLWVNGIAAGPNGVLYTVDNDAIHAIDRRGKVSVFRDSIQADECPAPLPDTPKLPYLRGIAVAADGTIYAAANGCRSVVAIPAKGAIRTILKADPPWSPTGVALFANDLYVLEYLHTPGDDRKAWIPRVRKISAGGSVKTIVTVSRAAQ